MKDLYDREAYVPLSGRAVHSILRGLDSQIESKRRDLAVLRDAKRDLETNARYSYVDRDSNQDKYENPASIWGPNAPEAIDNLCETIEYRIDELMDLFDQVVRADSLAHGVLIAITDEDED